jgi:SWI/SNF-related matrix-associated actin-dependent regulator 1 of chromatin subfamily A
VKLPPHQEVGRDFLVSHSRALLADGMRVGKSVQSIAAADALKTNFVDFRIVVICPASLREQWRRQFKQFSRMAHRLFVYSYEEAVKYGGKIANASVPCDLLILDESHYLKGRKSKRTTVVLNQIAPHAKRVWCLSGTPSPNNASELYPMLKALFPEVIARPDGSPMNFWQFTKKYCVVRTTPFGEKIEGNRNIEDLKQRMAPIMLRRPSTILGNTVLPPETLYLDTSAAELKRLEAELRKELGDQFGVDPEKLDDKVKARAGRLCGLAKVPALVERLKDEFESGLDKVVIFAWHADVIEALRLGLNRFVGASVVNGTTPMHAREGALRNFKDGLSRVFIGNIKAAGVGLDLTAACELIFAETSWVPGDNDQAAARITGVNQKRAARVRYAVLPGSLDERLTEVNRRKSKDNKELWG